MHAHVKVRKELLVLKRKNKDNENISLTINEGKPVDEYMDDSNDGSDVSYTSSTSTTCSDDDSSFSESEKDSYSAGFGEFAKEQLQNGKFNIVINLVDDKKRGGNYKNDDSEYDDSEYDDSEYDDSEYDDSEYDDSEYYTDIIDIIEDYFDDQYDLPEEYKIKNRFCLEPVF